VELTGRPLVDGSGSGPLLVLEKPLSFWGGVDPETGRIIDPRHPQQGEELGGRVLVMERAIGSSSSSAVMLELLRNGVAPAGVVMGQSDAILVLGVLVARVLGYRTIPVLEAPDLTVGAWSTGSRAALTGNTLSLVTD
jgi:predicted aconitase with swiveling domain